MSTPGDTESTTPSRLTRRSLLAVGAVAVPVAIAGCAKSDSLGEALSSGGSTPSASGGTTAGSAAPSSATPTPTPTPATLTVTAQHPLTAVQPTDTLTFTASHGTLRTVKVLNAKKETVDGTLTGTTWKPKVPFRLSSTYTVVATLANADSSAGATVDSTTTIKTLQADSNTASLLYEGSPVGVGMPVIVKFENEVVDATRRAAIQKAMTIDVSPAQEGAWGWIDNTQLMWRPKSYWKAGTKVQVSGKLAGLTTSSHRWLLDDLSGTLDVGDSRIIKVSIPNHSLSVVVNGSTVKTFPCTTGKDGFVTRSGTKVIIERESHMVMDAATVGIPTTSPDYYKLAVDWAMRETYTGEFIHAAPWSTKSQGLANVSHGCVGLATANAKWLFNLCRAGDVVETTGSNRTFKPSEGIGCWCYDWSGWQGLSAV